MTLSPLTRGKEERIMLRDFPDTAGNDSAVASFSRFCQGKELPQESFVAELKELIFGKLAPYDVRLCMESALDTLAKGVVFSFRTNAVVLKETLVCAKQHRQKRPKSTGPWQQKPRSCSHRGAARA